MFDFLKKKISNFIDSVTGKEEEKKEPEIQKKEEPIEEKSESLEEIIEEPKPEEVIVSEPVPDKVIVKPVAKPEEKKQEIKKVIESKPVAKSFEQIKPAPKIEVPIIKPKIETPKIDEKPKPQAEKPKIVKEITGTKKPEPKKIIDKIESVEPQPIEIPESLEEIIEKPKVVEKVIEKTKIEQKVEKVEEIKENPEPVKEEKARIKLSPFTAIKSLLTSEVEIKESDLKDLIDSLELELLEADVEMSVAEIITKDIRERLLGKKVEKKTLHNFIGQAIKETLIEILHNDKTFDILEVVEKTEKPVKIMFIGINGAGKTTTIAKVAKMLLDKNKKVVFAAADTFRAAAIEQMEVHADRLGIKMIKRDYGSDPTSVAYDAANYAKAHSIDVVLIDTTGRHDTNTRLINEIKKMNRVIVPTLKIYVGESIAGNAIIEQVATFNREIGIDGVILTKLDCDAKGGTVLSINKATGIPIVYIGTGQKYEDLEIFDAKKIVDRIIG